MLVLNKVWRTLLEPTDSGGIFPVYFRVGLYGLLLFFILLINSSSFDSTELVTLVAFIATITVVEIFWKNLRVGKRLIWHLASLVTLMILLGVLFSQATKVRESWYKTHVLANRIETLISTAPNAIIVSDGKGIIKYLNSKATDLIGWTNEDVIGKPVTILMRPHKRQAHLEGFHNAVQSLKQGKAEWLYKGDKIFRIVSKSGRLSKVRIYIVGIRYSGDYKMDKDTEGLDIEFYAILHPIEELVDPEEAMEIAVEKQAASSKEDKRDKREENQIEQKEKDEKIKH